MFLGRSIAIRFGQEARKQIVLATCARSFAVHSSLAPRKKRDYISSDVVDKDQLTPALQQYYKFKEQYKDYVLFFRLGDFYEFFFEDAIRVSQILGIALTTRGKYKDKDIPLCGIPYFTVDNYVKKIIRRGLKVAICEQTETPSQNKSKKRKSPVLERSVVRLISAGTLVEDSLLTPRRSNFLCALSCDPDSSHYGFSVVDISTGEIAVHNVEEAQLASLLARYDPREILLSSHLQQHLPPSLQNYLRATGSLEMDSDPEVDDPEPECVMTVLSNTAWDDSSFLELVQSHTELQVLQKPMEEGLFSKMETMALAALLQYVNTTQMGSFPRLYIAEEEQLGVLELDRNTRESLNLTRGVHDSLVGSVMNTIDRTVTVMGSRLLSNRLSSPLTNPTEINSRLDTLSFFISHSYLSTALSPLLKTLGDSERSFQRLLLRRGSPQDLGVIRDMLRCCGAVKEVLQDISLDCTNPVIHTLLTDITAGASSPLLTTLSSALTEGLPFTLSDGGFIAPGYSAELDEWRALAENDQTVLKELQQQYAEQTGISKLKVKWTDALGFHVEVPTSTPLTDTTVFYPCQMLKSHIRYKTADLTALDGRRHQASEKVRSLEISLFEDLKKQIEEEGLLISRCNSSLSVLDVNCGLERVCRENGYVRPVVNDSSSLHLHDIRHLVIEDLMMRQKRGKTFIPNSIEMDCTSPPESTRTCVLTGPNMGGKTTFLRSVALCVILAQMGCFIPAKEGCIGVVDKIFSRVGSADDIVNDRSTFYSEISETSTILKNATSRSLILVDELGRGTSVDEGIAIATHVLEYIHSQIRCKTLFATHYRPVTELVHQNANMRNFKMCAVPTSQSLLLSYRLEPGVSDQSYGLFIAQMAGIPSSILDKCKVDVEEMKKKNDNKDNKDNKEKEVCNIIKQLKLDELTPLQCMACMNELRGVLQSDNPKQKELLHSIRETYCQ